jgi:hypothetical protein
MRSAPSSYFYSIFPHGVRKDGDESPQLILVEAILSPRRWFVHADSEYGSLLAVVDVTVDEFRGIADDLVTDDDPRTFR